jgi:hypothetical protein
MLTLAEAAAAAHVTSRTIRRWIAAGLPFTRVEPIFIDSPILIDPAAIEAFPRPSRHQIQFSPEAHARSWATKKARMAECQKRSADERLDSAVPGDDSKTV